MEEKLRKILDFLYDKRYRIALILFILCLVFKLNGSSIGLWNGFMNLGHEPDENVIFGVSRGVRADEYAVLTPMFAAQVQNGFQYFNDALRATKTDVFMIYALPVSSIFQIFRPFLIGFIVFGTERGLSFFWCGRLIALFIVTLDLCMILTKKNKLLSYIGALMVTLAPIVQWWFAVNGIAEIFIFGELAVIMLYKYLNTENFKKRLLYLFVAFICAGGYVLVVYPSWQVPMVYVFLALAIWVIIENRKNSKITRKDIISIFITVFLLGISMLCILSKSKETIEIVSNTVYPGSRFELGGRGLNKILSYITDIYLPIKMKGLISNQCEASMMFGLFPIGIILAIRNLILNKKKDKLLICLLVAYVFLGAWCVVGFPRILAKITLLSNSQADRASIALGFIDILLLVRSIPNMEKPIKPIFAALYSLVISVFLVTINSHLFSEYLTTKMTLCLYPMCIFLFYTILRYNKKVCKYLFTMGIVFVMLFSGGLVNPIRTGAKPIVQSEVFDNAKRIDKEDTGIWITEGYPYPINNYIAMAGVKTINVTNTYPSLKTWYKIDPDKKYEDIYNRYAHINMYLKNEDEIEEKFIKMNGSDYISIDITTEDLKKLNVKYIFTGNDLEKFNSDNIEFNKKYEYNNYKIYKVLYK